MKNNKLLQEFRLYSGLLTESDDFQLVQNMLPGVRNAVEHCKEACEKMDDVLVRLEKVSEALKRDNNSLHLPAEATWLSGQLREVLRHILSSEEPIRKAMSALDQLK